MPSRTPAIATAAVGAEIPLVAGKFRLRFGEP
jgi:hypothetical protein